MRHFRTLCHVCGEHSHLVLIRLFLGIYVLFPFVSVCYAARGGPGAPRKTAYRSINVLNGGSKFNAMAYLLVVVLIVVVVSMGCLASRMYRRTKRLEKQLQYEMHDVRNIARTGVVGEASPLEGETAG